MNLAMIRDVNAMENEIADAISTEHPVDRDVILLALTTYRADLLLMLFGAEQEEPLSEEFQVKETADGGFQIIPPGQG